MSTARGKKRRQQMNAAFSGDRAVFTATYARLLAGLLGSFVPHALKSTQIDRHVPSERRTLLSIRGLAGG